MAGVNNIRDTWLGRLLSTEPADRARAEGGVRDLYVNAGWAAPRHLCWFESPFAAAWAVAVLLEDRDPSWQSLLGSARKSRAARPQIEQAEVALCQGCGASSLEAARATIGLPVGTSLQFMPRPGAYLQPLLVHARIEMRGGDVAALMSVPSDSDPLHSAEQRLCIGSRAALASGLICHPAGTLVARSFLSDYSMSAIAADEEAAQGRALPPILRAASDVAAAAGLWWPFASGAMLAERPSELHVDEDHFLHSAAGAAVTYRDGTQVYAWHGMTVPSDWILHPEAVPPAKLRGLDPSLRKFVESRRRGAPPMPRARPGAVWAAKLPTTLDDRFDALRQLAGGKLPLFDRYVAGEHSAVWSELVAQGAAVRHDPLAPDALAVAYETMRRVDRNVRTLVERLVEIGFQFTTPDGAPRKLAAVHVPPGSRTGRSLQQLEKSVGLLPLSLRAFYEVVGAIDLIGRDRAIVPSNGSIPPDPLVVSGVEDLLAQVGDADDDLLILAPDDLHKAGTSGGDPYAMAVPEPAADGVVLNERHELLFVDYLRLCCRFGGFPGYEGQDDVPVEIERLTSGLLEF